MNLHNPLPRLPRWTILLVLVCAVTAATTTEAQQNEPPGESCDNVKLPTLRNYLPMGE